MALQKEPYNQTYYHLTSNTGSESHLYTPLEIDITSRLLVIVHFSAVVARYAVFSDPVPLLTEGDLAVSMGVSGWTQLGTTEYAIENAIDDSSSTVVVNAVWHRMVDLESLVSLNIKLNFDPNYVYQDEVDDVIYAGCSPVVRVMAFYPPRTFRGVVAQESVYGSDEMTINPSVSGAMGIILTTAQSLVAPPDSVWAFGEARGWEALGREISWPGYSPVASSLYMKDIFEIADNLPPLINDGWYLTAHTFGLDFFDSGDGWTVGSIG